jgi:hypothetical protein
MDHTKCPGYSRVRIQSKQDNILIGSKAIHSSLAFHPSGLPLSSVKTFVSGIKGEEVNVPIVKVTSVKYKDNQTNTNNKTPLH